MSGKIEDNLTSLIKEAVKRIAKEKALPVFPHPFLETPRLPSQGHLTTNIALKLAGCLKRSPMEMAQAIAAHLALFPSLKTQIEKTEIKPPGFINFFLSAAGLAEILLEVQKKGVRFGDSRPAKRKKVQIEFVSANPTGPLSVAHARQAAVGDSLAFILSACGYRIVREYYINDEGSQIDLLGESVRARCAEILREKLEFPTAGYRGRYIYALAASLIEKFGRETIRKKIGRGNSFFSLFASSFMLGEIKKDLADFGVNFDVWFSQRSRLRAPVIERSLDALERRGHLYQKEGALWFRSSQFGDDKDRVVKKSDGTYTYIAPDIAYHQNKFRRGFHRVINLWGPDHHGYINRLKAAVEALGIEKEALAILIVQLTTLYRKGKPVPMSTRAGEFVTLREIIKEVGKDAARFFFLMRKKEAHLDFDLELAKKKTLDNPVYYIQYAHARIWSIIGFARKRGFSLRKSSLTRAGRCLLTSPEEIALLQQLRQFPPALASAALSLEPYRIVLYLQKLTDAFHRFYAYHRVVGEDKKLSRSRLLLVDSTRIVLAKGLALLGIAPPRKM